MQEFRSYLFPNDNLCNLHIPAALYGQYLNLEAPMIVRNPLYVLPRPCPCHRHTHPIATWWCMLTM